MLWWIALPWRTVPSTSSLTKQLRVYPGKSPGELLLSNCLQAEQFRIPILGATTELSAPTEPPQGCIALLPTREVTIGPTIDHPGPALPIPPQLPTLREIKLLFSFRGFTKRSARSTRGALLAALCWQRQTHATTMPLYPAQPPR